MFGIEHSNQAIFVHTKGLLLLLSKACGKLGKRDHRAYQITGYWQFQSKKGGENPQLTRNKHTLKLEDNMMKALWSNIFSLLKSIDKGLKTCKHENCWI